MEGMAEMNRAPTGRNDELLRRLYSPWVFGVYIPFLAISTVGWGTLTIAVSQFSQRLAFHCGTAWAWSLCRANFTKVIVGGRENVDPDRSYVMMSNHQSHFDSLAIYGHWRHQFRWVMKQELRKIPALGRACEDIGHIFIDRSDRQRAIESLRAARERLEPGVSILFFPEGSRSPDGRLGTFKKGGFVMAQEMDLPILPISISGSSRVLPNRSFAMLPGTVHIRIHPAVETAGYNDDEREQLMADVREAIASGLNEWERSTA